MLKQNKIKQTNKRQDYGIQSHHFTANRKEKGGSSSDRFPLLDSKITGDSDCSHSVRRKLLLGRKGIQT